jgi:hypothetical protein
MSDSTAVKAAPGELDATGRPPSHPRPAHRVRRRLGPVPWVAPSLILIAVVVIWLGHQHHERVQLVSHHLGDDARRPRL